MVASDSTSLIAHCEQKPSVSLKRKLDASNAINGVHIGSVVTKLGEEAASLYRDLDYDGSYKLLAQAMSLMGVIPYQESLTLKGSEENWTPLPDMFIYQREDYDEGMNVFMDHEQIDVRNKNQNETSSVLLFNAGQTKYRLKHYEAAFYYYKNALHCLLPSHIPEKEEEFAGLEDLLNNPPSITHSVIIPILHNIAHLLYYRRYKLQETTRLYKEALTHCREIHGDDHSITAATRNCLGLMYYHSACATENERKKQEMLEKSAMHLQNALENTRKLSGNSLDTAVVQCNIGRVYVSLGKFDNGIKHYDAAYAIRREKLGVDDFQYADAGLMIGQALKQKGNAEDYDRVVSLLQDFLRVARIQWRKNYNNQHRDIADTIKEIGMVYANQGKYDAAIQAYQESIPLVKASLGSDHLEVCNHLSWLANAQFSKGNYSGALETYKEELQIESTILKDKPAHRNMIVSLMNIGIVLMEKHDYENAMKFYEKSLSLYKKRMSDNPFLSEERFIIYVYFDIGRILQSNGDYQNAMINYKGALHIARSYKDEIYVGDNDQRRQKDVASVLQKIGNLHLVNGNTQSMMQNFIEAARIYLNVGICPFDNLKAECGFLKLHGYDIRAAAAAAA